MERATGTEVYGCGSPQSTDDITLNIQTTTGGNFSICLGAKNTVEHLKKLVSKKLKVSKDRICLLHRERQLREGTLEANGLMDGSRIVLLPSVETGLLSQRPENTVMQALESLNETQVNDFLSGKSPLNLTMRLGDHMMLIQLQLSTLSSSSRSLKTSTPTKKNTSSPQSASKREAKDSLSLDSTEKSTNHECESHAGNSSSDKGKHKDKFHTRGLQRKDLELLKDAIDLYRSINEETCNNQLDSTNDTEDDLDTTNCSAAAETSTDSDQSPIKSLSNLVSSPLDLSLKDIPSTSKECVANSVTTSLMELLSKSKINIEPKPSCSTSNDTTHTDLSPDGSLSEDSSDNYTDQGSFLTESTIDEYPMENLFNTAVDKGLFEDQDETMCDREISNLATMSHGTQESSASSTLPSFQSINDPLKGKRFQYLLHKKTSKFKHPISKQKVFMQSVVNKHKKRMQIKDNAEPSSSRSEPYTRKLVLQPASSKALDLAIPSSSKDEPCTDTTIKTTQTSQPEQQVDSRDLIEASKNLTQKLKKLSKEVLTNKVDIRTPEETYRSKGGPGAVIESMKHHGKGIYSGTFSGTLNPALQDRYGRPKRDISTIIHILNDLLCATPPITLSQSESKTTLKKTTTSDKSGEYNCAYGECEGHSGASAVSGSGSGVACSCDSAASRAAENSKTKCKLEQLRLVMQQKKQRREARRRDTMPYAAPPPPRDPPQPCALDA